MLHHSNPNPIPNIHIHTSQSTRHVRSFLDSNDPHLHSLPLFLPRRFNIRIPLSRRHKLRLRFHLAEFSRIRCICVWAGITYLVMDCVKVSWSRRLEYCRSNGSLGVRAVCLDPSFGMYIPYTRFSMASSWWNFYLSDTLRYSWTYHSLGTCRTRHRSLRMVPRSQYLPRLSLSTSSRFLPL